MREGLTPKQIKELHRANLQHAGLELNYPDHRTGRIFGYVIIGTIGVLILTAGALLVLGYGDDILRFSQQALHGLESFRDGNGLSGAITDNVRVSPIGADTQAPNLGNPNVPLVTQGTKGFLCGLHELFCPR